MATASRITTADELLRMADDGWRYELVEGELRRMTPAGCEHGYLSNLLGFRLTDHVLRHKLGFVFSSETGYRIGRIPDTVLAPDVSFVRAERIAITGMQKAFHPESPALVVEVVSPGDTAEEVDDKMRRWLAAGVELGWVVYPGGRTVTVYRSFDDIRVLTENDLLDGAEVVPGFQLRVGDLFAGLTGPRIQN